MPFARKTHNWATARNFTYSPKKPIQGILVRLIIKSQGDMRPRVNREWARYIDIVDTSAAQIHHKPIRGTKEPSQNNFSKSTLRLYDPGRESPVFCLGIPGSCSSIQIPHGHRYTSFLKPYFWDRERDGSLCRTQRSCG